jgi:membrane protein
MQIEQEGSASLPQMAWEAVRRLFADEAIPLAGNIAFRALFSVFPFLIFLVTLAGFFGNEGLATGIVDFLLDVAPEKLVSTLAPEIHSILTVPRTGLLSLSVALTIWSAMGGVDSVRVALNRAYDVRETRPVWLIFILDVVFVVGAAVLLLVAAGLLVLFPVAVAAIGRFAPLLVKDLGWIETLRVPLAIVLIALGLQAAHRLLPAKQQTARDILPGVLVTTLVWVVVALAFSTYLVNFNTFASTYASLSGLFAAMFFLYLSALVLILGGEFNRVLQIHRQRRKPANQPVAIE